jgi:phage head maturation protease
MIKEDVLLGKDERLNRPYAIKTIEGTKIAIKDIDLTKRIVTGFYNTYNYFDSDYDVLLSGSAKKSIVERGVSSNATAKIKHALFHDLTKLPGKIQVLDERTIDLNGMKITGIYFETKMLDTTDGNDTLIKYQEEVYDNHSIGFRYLDLEYIDKESEMWDTYLSILLNPEDADNAGFMYIVKEIKLYEGSTVAFGANQLTPFLGVKSQDRELLKIKVFERIDKLYKQLKVGTVSDESMKMFELQLLQLKQLYIEISDD